MSTTFMSIKEKALALPKAMWGFVAVISAGVFFLLWKFVIAPGSPTKEPMVAEAAPTEEEKRLWLAERQAQEKIQIMDSADKIKDQLAQIEGQLRHNYQEALQNQTKFKTMFSANKSSYDDDLSGMEDEQNINTSFMLKEDIEGQKQGMIKLGQELGKQKGYLMEDRNRAMETLVRLNQEWVQMFPGEQPLFTPPRHQPPPPPPVSPEQAAAQRDFDNSKTMMPDGIRDGTGREALPV